MDRGPSAAGFIWPIVNKVTSYFGPYHPLGIDINAPFVPVAASAAGQVVFVGGVADEPSGSLDARTGKVVTDLLFDLVKRRGTTLLLVTHSEELASACDRRLELVSGKLADLVGRLA